MPNDVKHLVLGVGALAACCAVHTVVLIGGIGALTGLLSSSYVIAGAVVLTTVTAVLLSRRFGRKRDAAATPQVESTGAEPADSREASPR